MVTILTVSRPAFKKQKMMEEKRQYFSGGVAALCVTEERTLGDTGVFPVTIINSKPNVGRTLPYKIPLEAPQQFVRKPYIKIPTLITSS
jgi:hypothetical protein